MRPLTHFLSMVDVDAGMNSGISSCSSFNKQNCKPLLHMLSNRISIVVIIFHLKINNVILRLKMS